MSKRPAIPEGLKRKVKIEARHRCAICKHPSIEIHHIDLHSKVREHKFENLIALCPNCHRDYHSGKIDYQSMLYYKKQLQKNIVDEVISCVSNNLHKNKPKRLGITVAPQRLRKEKKE